MACSSISWRATAAWAPPGGLNPLWWAARYDRPLEHSACVARSYQSRQWWVETKRRWPELFAGEVETDARMRWASIRQGAVPVLPADAPCPAVGHNEATLGAEGHKDGFGNECAGHLEV